MWSILEQVSGWRGIPEAAIAGAVFAVMLAIQQIFPDLDWKEFKWAEMVRFGLCLALSLGVFVGVAYLGLEIPGMDPPTGLQGAFSAVVTGFIAYLMNSWAGRTVDDVVQRVNAKECKCQNCSCCGT